LTALTQSPLLILADHAMFGAISKPSKQTKTEILLVMAFS
jgi:hypothetical protein